MVSLLTFSSTALLWSPWSKAWKSKASVASERQRRYRPQLFTR
jgi:hypothetical protein